MKRIKTLVTAIMMCTAMALIYVCGAAPAIRHHTATGPQAETLPEVVPCIAFDNHSFDEILRR